MKHAPESNSTAGDLPSFLDSGTEVETATDDTLVEDLAAELEPVEDELVADEAESQLAEGLASDHGEPTGGKLLRRSRSNATATTGAAAPGNGTIAILFGCVCWVLAVVMATALANSNAAVALQRFGLGSSTLIVLGAVLFVFAMLRRHLATLPTGGASSVDDEWARTAREGLEFLVAAQHAQNERPPAAGEELQHVLMAMQRQDEKINNLTKAIKMYGKPLMEISGQSTDLAGAIAHAKTAIEASAEAARQAFSRLETQLRHQTPTKELAELIDGVHVIAADVDKLTKKGGGESLAPLAQQVGRVEVAVAALAQRLESSEVQKSLLRLEDATQKTRDEVHKLHGDGLGKATTQLQDRLDKATKGLADGLAQMRDGNLGGLENGVRDIQRELHGIATTVAQIQAVVRSGGGKAAAPAPTPAAASVPAPLAAPAPAATPAPSGAPAAAAGDKADVDNASYQTGKRQTSGKNVLGAIAKLKQMKN